MSRLYGYPISATARGSYAHGAHHYRLVLESEDLETAATLRATHLPSEQKLKYPHLRIFFVPFMPTVIIQDYQRGPYSLHSDSGEEMYTPAVPHRWLPGDTVEPTGTIIKRAAHKNILGIVDFRNRTSMGITSRGIPLFLFHPFDRGYPPFIVGSKEKLATNLLCFVDFVAWEDTWPRGGIQTRLSRVGDPVGELNAIRLQPLIPSPAMSIPEDPSIETHTDSAWDRVLHIDPPGCEDVDDVFGWRSIADGGTEYMIGISDVAAWIPEGSALDHHALSRSQTVYENGLVHAPMLPNAVSTGLASLRCDGKKRPVVALLITVVPGSPITVRFEQTMVAVTHSYTYDSVLKDTDNCDKIRSLLTTLYGKVSEDPHEWIEHLMVEYNKQVASVLRKAGVGILRSHKGTSNTEYEALATAKGVPELAHIGKQAGKYCRSTESEVAHAGLGLEEYCHASSPIRRYVDLYNQRWIKHLLFECPKPIGSVSILHLEIRARMAKQMEKDLWFRSHISYDKVTKATGFIIEHKMDTRYSVYVPEWKRILTGVCAQELHGGDSVSVSIYIDKANPRWYDRVITSLARI